MQLKRLKHARGCVALSWLRMTEGKREKAKYYKLIFKVIDHHFVLKYIGDPRESLVLHLLLLYWP